MAKLGDVAVVKGGELPTLPKIEIKEADYRILLTVANMLGNTSTEAVREMVAAGKVSMDDCRRIYRNAPFLNWRPFREVFDREPHHAAVSYWTARSVVAKAEEHMQAKFDRLECTALDLAKRVTALEAKLKGV